jgi:hypothetical protein
MALDQAGMFIPSAACGFMTYKTMLRGGLILQD